MSRPEDWWRGAVIYQIYPRSFQDSNGDGIGDLPGVITRLDYVKSLGVDGIWLSPFFTSPMRDFGYDVADYRGIDPMYGTMADFDALLAAAHDRGLKVIIDQVWSHSSSEHEWFQASRQDKQNDKSDWYVWAEPKPDGSPPNNWQAWFGGPAWTWEPRRRQYYLHNFLPTQPDLNLRNPEVREAIKDIARFWLDKGVDGFRLDVVNYYVHDAELRDNPPSANPAPALPRDMQEHRYNSNQPETLAFVEELRALTDEYEGRMMVGEIAPGSFDLMQTYTQGQKRLHTAYSFDLLGEWPGAPRLAEVISQWGEGDDDGWPSWALSNHDVTRIASRWDAAIGASNTRTALLGLILLAMLRGTVFIYQGEELGLAQADIPFEKLKDPWGVAGWPENRGRDGCRTPMPWKSSPGGGFSTGEPWLPVSPRQLLRSAEEQENTKPSVLRLTRALFGIRKHFQAMQTGSLRILEPTGSKGAQTTALVFVREGEGEELLCALNFSDEDVVIETVMANDFERIFGVAVVRDNRFLLAPQAVFLGLRKGAETIGAQSRREPILEDAARLQLPV